MTSRPLADRFWEKVDVRSPSECWEWTASRNPRGDGQISYGNKILRAHRVSYELNKGVIPEGMQVLHACHNRGCVNPKHIRLGTNADNMIDMAKANRSGVSKLSLKEVAAIREVRKRHSYCNSGITVWLAEWFGLSQPQVSAICTGRKRRHTNAN